MGLLCTCESGQLPNQIDVTCAEDMDQIVRIAFQKPQADFPFATANTIDLANSWTTLLAAADDTKIVLSPAVANLVIPASEGVFQGENSNESVNGLGYYLGEQNVRITAEVHSAPQLVMDALADLSCYTDVTLGASGLKAFFFLRRIKGVSRVVAKAGTDANDYDGFEIFNLRVSSPASDGYNSKTKYMISFDMQPDEWQSRALVSLGFNPLALANVITT